MRQGLVGLGAREEARAPREDTDLKACLGQRARAVLRVTLVHVVRRDARAG